jgi:hypothetical protein
MRSLLFAVGGVAAAYSLTPKIVSVYENKTNTGPAPGPGYMTRAESIEAGVKNARMPLLAVGALVGYLLSRVIK